MAAVAGVGREHLSGRSVFRVGHRISTFPGSMSCGMRGCVLDVVGRYIGV